MTTPTNSDLRWHGRSIPKRHWHFHRQLLARYGIVLAPGEFSDMLRDIRNGGAQLVEKRRGNFAIYSARISRLSERVFVLSNGKDLFTAWPPSRKLRELRRAAHRPKFILHFRTIDPDDE